MARIQKKIPLLILLLLTSSAAALELDISLDADAKAAVKDVKFSDNFTEVLEANASVYNSGSFECSYRLRADINETESGESYEAYSRAKNLFPGERERMNVYYMPQNYSGPIESNLYIEYCGEEELVEEFEANSTERTTVKNTLELEERSVNDTEAEADLNISEALLVPREKPAFWKVGYAEVENSTAVLEYDTLVFNSGRNITYIAYNSSSKEPLGKVEADLEAEETLLQKVKNNKYLIGLSISLLVNAAFVVYLLRIRRSEA